MSTHVTSEKSARIQRTLKALRDAREHGLSSRQLILKTGSCAPAADVSDLRKLGHVIFCTYHGKTGDGRKVYRYYYGGRRED